MEEKPNVIIKGTEIVEACCKIHEHQYGYLCKCKKIWADNEKAREHIATCSYIRFSTKLYDHNDCPQSLARKIVSGSIDCYC